MRFVADTVECPPPPLRQFKNELSPELEKIVLKSIEKDPDARYQTARDFYLILEEFERSGVADFSRVASPARNTLNDDGRGTGVAIVNVTTIGFSEHSTGLGAAPTDISQSTSAPSFSNGAYTALERDGLGNYRRSPLPKVDAPTNRKTSLILGVALAALIIGIIAWGAYNRSKGTGTGQNSNSAAIPAGMISIPGGAFKMGRDDGNDYEKPAHEVTIKPFLIDETEVTGTEQYQQFVDIEERQPPSHWRNGHYADGEAKFPVVNVSWDDAMAYAKWTGKRLPTEEEWEFAARGTDGRLYPYGSEWKSNFSNAAEDNFRQPRPVQSYPDGRSLYGVYDMAGNVLEWTASEFKLYPGSKLDPNKDFNRDRLITRGGAFNAQAKYQTTTDRFFYTPSTKTDFIGFRCADLP